MDFSFRKASIILWKSTALSKTGFMGARQSATSKLESQTCLQVTKHLITYFYTGAFASFSEQEDTELMIKVLQASVAFSGMSPAIEINDSLYLTGNIIYENDVASAITHCEKLGYPRKDIIIDSLLAGSIYM
jgi:predicted patatin/cPLA2 family phospholipase